MFWRTWFRGNHELLGNSEESKLVRLKQCVNNVNDFRSCFLAGLGFFMWHIYWLQHEVFLCHTVREMFPEIFRSWIEHLQHQRPIISHFSRFIVFSWNPSGCIKGFLRTFQHRVGLYILKVRGVPRRTLVVIWLSDINVGIFWISEVIY